MSLKKAEHILTNILLTIIIFINIFFVKFVMCAVVAWNVLTHHWNGKVFILMKCSSLAALEVVKMTTSSAASDENFVKMTTFLFQW